MKVLFGYLSNAYRGGVKFQLDFAAQFHTAEVGFITSNSNLSYQDMVTAIGPVHLLPPTAKFFRRLKALKKLAAEYDIIYLNKASLHLPEFLLVRLAGFRKVVFHSHATYKEVSNPLERWLFHVMHFLAVPFVGLAADRLYACSQPAAVWLFGARNARKATVIKNGIDLNAYAFDTEERQKMRQQLGIDGFCVLHAGGLTAVKNQAYLIDAFSIFHQRHPDSVLLLAGDGELRDTLQAQIHSLGLSDCVRLLGKRSDVSALMQAADLFVLPSLSEGLPFVAVEAQAAGLPVIITDTATPEAKVLDSYVAFDIKRPPADLAAEMELAIGLPRQDTFGIMAKAGFDLKTCAAQLEKELFALVNS